VIRRVFDRLPRSFYLYHLCKYYVHAYNGEYNTDMSTNGEFHLLRRVAGGATVVFDVGANVGHWTAEAITCNRDLAVHCFEPCEAVCDTLRENLAGTEAVCNHLALGSEGGTLDLHVYGEAGTCNSLYSREHHSWLRGGGGATSERVRVTTFDDYCKQNGIEHVEFVKIDVEGHDFAVMRGMGEMLRGNAVDFVQFEYSEALLDANCGLRDIWAFFEALDYDLYKIFPRRLRRIPEYRNGYDNYVICNYVYVNRRIALADLGVVVES